MKKRLLWIIPVCLAVLLAVTALVGVATNWFGLYGPTTKLVLGAKKTLVTSESFFADFSVTNQGEEIKGQLAVEYVPEKRHLAMYMTAADPAVEGPVEIAIYDKTYIYHEGSAYKYKDISRELDKFFDEQEKRKEADFSWEDLLDKLSRDLYDELSAYISFQKLDTCLVTLLRKMNDEAWLEENAGFSQTKEKGVTVYTYQPDVYELFSATLQTMEPIFLKEKTYTDVEKGLEGIRETLQQTKATATYGLEKGRLVSAEFYLKGEYQILKPISVDTKVKIAFDKIGKTKLDTGDMEAFLKEAKEKGTQIQ